MPGRDNERDELESALANAGIDAYVENGGTRRPSDEHSINVASRRARVSGRLALTTQNVARLRYEGDWAVNHSHAGAFARNAASCSASNAASCLRSYE
jgi:hypothetical protein